MALMDHRNQIYDQWLVVRCLEGDVAALDELMTRWQERLWRHAARLTGDHDAAWDVLQETLMAISRGIRRLAEPAAFHKWAYRIASNKCRDHLRRKHRRRTTMEAYFKEEPAEHAPTAYSVQAMDLREALKRLSNSQQALVSLHYEEGFSVAEIAEILKIKAGTVKSRLHTARRQLRAHLLADSREQMRPQLEE